MRRLRGPRLRWTRLLRVLGVLISRLFLARLRVLLLAALRALFLASLRGAMGTESSRVIVRKSTEILGSVIARTLREITGNEALREFLVVVGGVVAMISHNRSPYS